MQDTIFHRMIFVACEIYSKMADALSEKREICYQLKIMCICQIRLRAMSITEMA